MLSRRVAVLCGVLFGFVTIAVACGDEESGVAAPPDAAEQPGSLGDSVCPDVAPASGEACLLPAGTTCAFGPCGSPIARCLGGVWRYSGNPDAAAPDSGPPCPKDFPASGSLCPACWPSGASCTYGSSDCSAPDASLNQTVASCPGGRWLLTTSPCGITDAGADVQGDAEPDAD